MLALAILGGASASGQTVRTIVDTDTLAIGARHRMVISIRHDASRQALFPDELASQAEIPPGAIGLAGDVELLRRISAGSRMLADLSRVDSVLYEVATFAVDTARVNAIAGLYTEADTAFFASVEGMLPVRSVVPEDADDIQDLAPLVEFPRALWPWFLALALGAGALWYFFLRKRPPEELSLEPEPAEPAEPPFDEAMRRFQGLAGALPDDQGMKPYFVELSDIVRTYIARRTPVPARELTTGELLDALRRQPVLDAERVREVDGVLSVADLVKFADHVPAPHRAQSTLEAARASIERAEHDLAPVFEQEEEIAG
ncbi:MAG: hypothetical protein ACI80V_001430 [Rhodothermales bacterium]|jgi:hypothetical protein